MRFDSIGLESSNVTLLYKVMKILGANHTDNLNLLNFYKTSDWFESSNITLLVEVKITMGANHVDNFGFIFKYIYITLDFEKLNKDCRKLLLLYFIFTNIN